MTHDQAQKVFIKARLLCACATKTQNKYAVSAQVYWSHLRELREALAEAGIDIDADRAIVATYGRK
jgi:hypothetical protein